MALKLCNMKDLKLKIKSIPHNPGVYNFKDKNEKIIYVGKAVNLFKRVSSYFTKTNDIKTGALIKNIRDIEFFVTNNEVEALLLENNLIKEHQPRYNIRLKDSKSYPMIKIINENLPRIIRCREKINKKDEYFGPFINVQSVKHLQKIFTEILKVRPCNKKFNKPYNSTPCIYYHIDKCFAPCASYISEEEYLSYIDTAREVLNGKTKHTIRKLKKKMMGFSERLEFEAAARIRDQIRALEEYETFQYVDVVTEDDCDYIGIYKDFNNASISLVIQRNGKIIDKKNFMVVKILDYSTVMMDFLKAYYLNINKFPRKIIISEDVDEKDVLSSAVKEKFNKDIIIKLPFSRKEKKIIILAKENAELYFEERQYKFDNINVLRELKKVLSLNKLPCVIEGFDVATLDGKFNTASLVSFVDGKPDKNGYRQFNIEDQEHPDDYSMMEEVIARRYQRLKNEDKKMPDLILVDGGKGQVNAAEGILEILNLDINIIGLAKKNEYIYKKNNKKPIILPLNSIALKLLQRVRDEAHRFSNTRLKKRVSKKSIQSRLLKVEGLGEKRINKIFKEFGSIDSLLKADIEEICKIEGIGKELAENIYKFIHYIE